MLPGARRGGYAQQWGREIVLFGAGSCLNEVIEMAKNESPDVSQNETPGEVMPLGATQSSEKGAGGSRTHDGGFAIPQ